MSTTRRTSQRKAAAQTQNHHFYSAQAAPASAPASVTASSSSKVFGNNGNNGNNSNNDDDDGDDNGKLSRLRMISKSSGLRVEAERELKKKVAEILNDPLEELSEQYMEGETFDIQKRYRLTEMRGKGSYGVVCSAVDQKTKCPVAVKKNLRVFPVYIPNESMDDDDEEYESIVISKSHPHRSTISQLRILRELKILIQLSSHPNIINLLDVAPPRDFNSFTDVYFITDLMEADLRDIIDSDQELTNDHVQYFMYQILIAMDYMHSANILHRDLKPENILLNSDCELKICDFGLARGMEHLQEDVTMSTAYVQTRWYRAPELLLNNPNATKKVDMWSVGCIFAELISRAVLFRGSNPVDQLKKIINIVGTPSTEDIKAGSEDGKQFIFTSIPYSQGKDFRRLFPKADLLALDLLKKLLHFNPDKRISAIDALRHPYFQSIFNEEDLEPATRITPFNYDFEKEAEEIGLKEICYETIMSFYKQQLRARIQKSVGRKSILNLVTDSTGNNRSGMDSPISTLLHNYFNNKQPQQIPEHGSHRGTSRS